MIIAITTSQPTIESPFAPDFGGAPYIVMVDTDAERWQACQNPAPQHGGHGMAAARFVAMQGAEAVISGDYCPHGYAALRSVGVSLYAPEGDATAAALLGRLVAGELAEAPQPVGHAHTHHAHRPYSGAEVIV